MHMRVGLHVCPVKEQSIVVDMHTPIPSQAEPVKVVPSAEHDVAPHAVPTASGLQVPGEVLCVQLTQLPMHSLSQQTPSAPQTPLAH